MKTEAEIRKRLQTIDWRMGVGTKVIGKGGWSNLLAGLSYTSVTVIQRSTLLWVLDEEGEKEGSDCRFPPHASGCMCKLCDARAQAGKPT